MVPLFNVSGRIGRLSFWIMHAIVVLVSLTLAATIRLMFNPENNGVYLAIVVCIIGYASLVTVAIRRLHDRDKSGWWCVPFYMVSAIFLDAMHYFPGPGGKVLVAIGAVIAIRAIVELGFLPGTDGPNRFGEPLAAT